MNDQIKIDTPIGKIEAKKVYGDYPGIWIKVDNKEMVLVEYDEIENKHVVRVWNHKEPDEDYVYKQIINKGER